MYDKEPANLSHPMSALRAGGGSAATAGQSRQLELPAAADRQDKAISILSELISELDVRLMPVTRSELPKGESSNGQVRPAPMTPAAARIEEHTDRITSIQMHVRSLLDRLEV